MTKLILLAIVALATLILWVLRRWWSKPVEISKLKEQADEITAQMAKILDSEPVDWTRYHKLVARLSQINRKIYRISTE